MMVLLIVSLLIKSHVWYYPLVLLSVLQIVTPISHQIVHGANNTVSTTNTTYNSFTHHH